MNILTENQIKAIQIEILDAVDAYCQEHGFTYFLIGGTLIGSLRHQGYIPWDDDIDIVMYRDEYECFIEEFNKNQSKYHVYSQEHDPGYNYHFSKISNMETYVEEDIRVCDIDFGINIDLFPLDKLPENANQQKILKKLHRLDLYMFCKSFRLNYMKKRPVRQRLKILAYRMLGIFTTREKLGRKQSEIAQTYNGTDTNNYSLITCHIRKRFPILNRAKTTAIKGPFEGREYSIPSTYHEYLTEQFGDYMTPPPENQRISGHNFFAFKK